MIKIRAMYVIVAMLALSLTSPLYADSYPRPNGFAVTHYSFKVTLNDASNQIMVQDTVVLRITKDGVREVALDLCQYRTHEEPADPSNPCFPRHPYGSPTTPLAPTTGTGMQVTAVQSASGTALAYRQAHDRLIVTLARPTHVGEQVKFTADYHGVPANGLVIGKNRYGDRGFFTNPWPNLTRDWLAVIDHPSMKATKTIAVTAPRKYQVLSNGVKTQETDLPNDMRLTVWNETVPICTWQFSLVAAPMAVDYFGKFHGIPLSAWVFPQERAVGFRVFSKYTLPILEFYVDHIGPFSYEKLAQVEANGVGGGTELASDIFYGGYPPGSGPSPLVIAHEMAHQWFGDSVTEDDWDDVWLSEGFATYFTLLYTEYQDGHDAFLRGVEASARKARQYMRTHPSATIVHPDLRHAINVFSNGVEIYQGGAQVLQMVRGVVGTKTFWEGIRLYYKRYRNHNATSLDFQHAMEDACRQDSHCPPYGRNLSWFFQEWLHRGGIMNVKGSWHYDTGSHELVVAIDQTPNHGRLYQMPFQIYVTPRTPNSAQPHKDHRVRPAPLPVLMVKVAHNTLRISMAHAPKTVTLDPNHWATLVRIGDRQLLPADVTSTTPNE